ncbi:MAG: RNA polymerase sigma factor, partial [Flavobacterium sp.]
MKNEDFSDNDTLIASLKNGEEMAYVYLVDTYHNKLCIYANSLIKNVYSAEDIVQNVFIKIWKQRTRLKADRSLKSFLYKSVYNEFIDLYRKNQSLLSIEKSYYEALDAIVLEEDSESIQR